MTTRDWTGAPCLDSPDDWFTADPMRVAIARHLCRERCPHRAACLTEALQAQPSDGVWAGYTAEEIRRTAKGRRVA